MGVMDVSAGCPQGRAADVPSPNTNTLLTPRDLQDPAGTRQSALGTTFCCHQLPWESAGGAGYLSCPSPPRSRWRLWLIMPALEMSTTLREPAHAVGKAAPERNTAAGRAAHRCPASASPVESAASLGEAGPSGVAELPGRVASVGEEEGWPAPGAALKRWLNPTLGQEVPVRGVCIPSQGQSLRFS